MVQIEYEVGPAHAPAFVAAMDEVGHLRRRNGAVRWRLFQDVADAATAGSRRSCSATGSSTGACAAA